ncbi:outer membrane usher protein [Novosphingobium sp. PhB165]|uniref:fimbria/pilus outer membrane usher protein n=1 Tax=Novosphingobium sp. PhB165 TaxID=2485105 RepID=UPI0010459936|nr:fimbria/pilus outer membrane usher protein [Novosphingobium sp. PhB165]TCM20665.1 outer membrane usher protein [Novosphingobium sp. PhB165]
MPNRYPFYLLGLAGLVPFSSLAASVPEGTTALPGLMSGTAMSSATPSVVAAAPDAGLAGHSAAKRLNPTGRDIPMGGPLSDNGFVLGEVSYTLKADDSILVDVQDLLPLLRNVLSADVWQRLADGVSTQPTVSIADLPKYGVSLAYDPSTLGLLMTVDPKVRQRQSLRVMSGYEPVAGPIQPAEAVSAYVTAFVNSDYVYTGPQTGFITPNVLLDSAVRVGGVVLENEASVQDVFRREGTRLVYDDQRHTARYTVGDLEPVSRGFSGTSPMAGVSLSRVYADLDPQRNVQPQGQRSFTLTRASTVETIVNGQSVQVTRLNPGTYDISDFPFAQGSNDVKLLIRDDSGRENVISFSINFDRTLLAAGLSEFGIYGGVKTPFDTNGRTYSDEPVASGFYRHGLTEELTVGANFQAQRRGAVAGAEVVWASPVGTLALNLAGSHNTWVGSGYAVNIGYELSFVGTENNGRSLTASIQATSKDFALPDTLAASNPYLLDIGATYSQSLGADHYFSLDGFYSVGRGSRQDQSTFRATYGWRPNQRLLLTAEASYEKSERASGPGARVSLIYRFDQNSSVTSDFDTQNDRARLSYQRSSGTGVGSYNASANIDRVDDSVGLNATVNYMTNRAELGAAHYTSFDNNGTITDQRTSLRAAFSLAYAGGSVALSRPIYDSFAIVKTHDSLKGAPVYIDPRGDDYVAKSGLFGGAVVPQLSAYSPRLITYDVPGAPAGYDVGTGIIQVRPPYRSGHLIEIGSDYFVTYAGQLLKPDGTPLALVGGHAIEVSKPDRKPVDMFTNRTGRFAVQGLRAGKWRIEMPTDEGTLVYEIDVTTSDALQRGAALKPERTQ